MCIVDILLKSMFIFLFIFYVNDIWMFISNLLRLIFFFKLFIIFKLLLIMKCCDVENGIDVKIYMILIMYKFNICKMIL